MGEQNGMNCGNKSHAHSLAIPDNKEAPAGLNDRPLVTFAVIAYNQEEYIREAVKGAFAQNYEPLEIILSDDCSTDGTFEIMQEMIAAYEGRHRVRLNRNDLNLGVAAHVNRALMMADGDIIVLAAGDDISFPNRTEVCVQQLLRLPDVYVIESEFVSFSDCRPPALKYKNYGTAIVSLEDYIAGKAPAFVGATRALRRELQNLFPELNRECPTEDTPLLLRGLMAGRVAYVKTPLVYRRLHSRNLSNPDSLARMSLERILEQYQGDIQHAHAMGFLSEAEARRIERWAVRTIRRRKVHYAIECGGQPLRTWFTIAASDWRITPREKVGLFLRAWHSSFAPKQAPSD